MLRSRKQAINYQMLYQIFEFILVPYSQSLIYNSKSSSQYSMIKAHIQKNEALMKMVRMFLAHYLTTVQGFSAFQTDSITLLATWIVKFIKKLAARIKLITSMQGKTESNIFHLMWTLEQQQLAPLKELIDYMRTRKDGVVHFNHTFFQKLKQEIFEDDIQKLNKLPIDDKFSNIQFTKKPYNIQIKNEALPFKIPIQQLYPFPPQYTYKTTRKSLQNEEINTEFMNFQTVRDTKRTIAEFGRKRQRQQEGDQSQPFELGIKKVKKVNLLKDI